MIAELRGSAGARFELLDISLAEKKIHTKNPHKISEPIPNECVWVSEDHKAEVNTASFTFGSVEAKEMILLI